MTILDALDREATELGLLLELRRRRLHKQLEWRREAKVDNVERVMVSMEVIRMPGWLVAAAVEAPFVVPTDKQNVAAQRGRQAAQAQGQGEVAHQDQP
eukprot:CAMPEP_0179164986 /NCGR_PEP_ID=MMETSP0796-20121207/81014_1 /TAXON_ID=73915 /ORGANISM="Pyrodinium bahamense, Strain pbaha01" /LENGTH=97 /DNA_ID=CAMNT_0020867517 /DNA_START=92 /DNA_END=381 /DNA_ORIENTATION=+